MDKYALGLIEAYGYLGMFLGMILEAVIIIIPSELILATGGILAGKNVFTLPLVFLIGLLGSVFCAIIIYIIGYYGGYPFVQKYGKYFFMKEEDIEKSSSWLNKYGLTSAAIGRNIPIVRTLISLPIGILRLSFVKFLIYTIIGSIPWTFAFVYFGYSLGNNWVKITNLTSRIETLIYILFGFLLIKYLYTKIKIIIIKKFNK